MKNLFFAACAIFALNFSIVNAVKGQSIELSQALGYTGTVPSLTGPGSQLGGLPMVIQDEIGGPSEKRLVVNSGSTKIGLYVVSNSKVALIGGDLSVQTTTSGVKPVKSGKVRISNTPFGGYNKKVTLGGKPVLCLERAGTGVMFIGLGTDQNTIAVPLPKNGKLMKVVSSNGEWKDAKDRTYTVKYLYTN